MLRRLPADGGARAESCTGARAESCSGARDTDASDASDTPDEAAELRRRRLDPGVDGDRALPGEVRPDETLPGVAGPDEVELLATEFWSGASFCRGGARGGMAECAIRRATERVARGGQGGRGGN